MVGTLGIGALRAEVIDAVHHNEDGRAADAAQRFAVLLRRINRSGDARPEVLEQQARVLLGLSSSRLDIDGRIEDAMLLLADAEDAAERATATHLVAAIRGQRGLLLLRLGETEQALRALDQAAEVFEEAKPYDQMRILLNRGVLHLEVGALHSAYHDLAQCVEIAETVGDADLTFKARHNLGYVDFLAGNLPRALAAMAQAARDKPGDPHPIALLDRARVLREGGLVRDADTVLAESAELFAATKLFQDLGETELVRAECALVEGEPARARRLATSALRRFSRRHNVRWQRKAELVVLQASRAAIGDSAGGRAAGALARVARDAEQLSGSCEAEGRSDLGRRAALLAAEARLAAGEPAAPIMLRLNSRDPVSTRLQTREVRARLALAAGDERACAREVRRGLAELGSYQSRFGSLELRMASAAHGVRLARLDLDLALRGGRAGAVLSSVERTRAISTRLAAVRRPRDEVTANLLAELRGTDEEARALEGDVASAGTLARLRSRSAELQRLVRARAWEQEGSASVGGSVTGLGELRAALREDGSVLVSYVRHGQRWFAIRVTGGGAELVQLDATEHVDELVRRVRADLDALAMPRLPHALRVAVAGSLQNDLGRLDETLIRPLRVDGSPLVVTAGGPLVVLPWSLLPSRSGLPVVLASSATAWMKSRAATPRRRETRVTVVAGPGLNRAEDEGARVQRIWGSSRLLAGDDATTEGVRTAVATADVVHIAAHGTHQQESPLFSSVRLADGPLYAYEIDAEEAIAGCVALSSCEAGLRTTGPGDEGLGLTSVLLHLGARSVLAGVARVGDDIAVGVMELVHRAMVSGVDSATALAIAQVECKDLLAPAPFVCFGAAWRR